MSKHHDLPRFRTKLELLLKNASEDHRYLSKDLPAYQANYLRTYLWLATVLIAFNASIYGKLLEGTSSIPFLQGHPTACFNFGAAVSLVLLLIVFWMGVDAMRGRRNVEFPFGNYVERYNEIWTETEDDNEPTLGRVLATFQQEITHQSEVCSRVATKLRYMSRLLLGSVATTLLTLFFFIISS